MRAQGRPIAAFAIGAAILAAAFVFLARDFVRKDDCLDAGGAWRDGACEGRRPGE